MRYVGSGIMYAANSVFKNTRNANYFIIFFTNYYCSELLSVSQKVMSVVSSR